MGFLVLRFEAPNYVILTDMYVSIYTFNLFREENAWMIRYYLQAFPTYQDRNRLDKRVFLPYAVETNVIPYDESQNVFTQIYDNAMPLFGRDNCIPIPDDTQDPFVTRTAEEEAALLQANTLG